MRSSQAQAIHKQASAQVTEIARSSSSAQEYKDPRWEQLKATSLTNVPELPQEEQEQSGVQASQSSAGDSDDEACAAVSSMLADYVTVQPKAGKPLSSPVKKAAAAVPRFPPVAPAAVVVAKSKAPAPQLAPTQSKGKGKRGKTLSHDPEELLKMEGFPVVMGKACELEGKLASPPFSDWQIDAHCLDVSVKNPLLITCKALCTWHHYPSIYASIYLSISLSIHLSIYLDPRRVDSPSSL